MVTKISLYYNTIKYMKITQIYYRLKKMLGLSCSLGCKVISDYKNITPITTFQELDYDPVFLSRFSTGELMQDKITLLHSSKDFAWDAEWNFNDKSALWNFNLHYCEYLFSITKIYKDTADKSYLDKCIYIIDSWIKNNPKEKGGAGWASYTVALRLTNWLSWYSAMERDLINDFKNKFIKSIHEQYVYLSNNLEKDLLGNHYLEDLKALILTSLFFNDEKMLSCALKEFKKECKEQILADGMHFELSPMYHKIIFEDVLRVAYALKSVGKADKEIEKYLQPMLDVAWSLEEGLERIPLFNDCGNNVAKSLDALVKASDYGFGLKPQYNSCLKNSGYYIFKQDDWKLIVDAGQPGAAYIPGHVHCDAMSFELFKAGKPIVVNCGTYAYQCNERSFFRSTAAHNTVMINDIEQSQCWSTFRLAKRSQVDVLSVSDDGIVMKMIDQKGHVVTRSITLRDVLVVTDESEGNKLSGCIHLLKDISKNTSGNTQIKKHYYAYEYGRIDSIKSVCYSGINMVKLEILIK